MKRDMKEFYDTHPELLARFVAMFELEKQGSDIRAQHVRCRNRSEPDYDGVLDAETLG
jgi:hypothetical protein